MQDQRYANAYIKAIVEPGKDIAFALILPDANGAGIPAFLDAFAKTIGKVEHVALVLVGASHHSGKTLHVPTNITLVPPPYSPELNLVERVWLYLKERFLSLRRLECLESPAQGVQPKRIAQDIFDDHELRRVKH